MSDSGICKIKSEYVLPENIRQLSLTCVSEADKQKLEISENKDRNEPPEKRQRFSKADKKLRGQNKSRPPTFKRNFESELCNTLINIAEDEEVTKCTRKNCAFLHNVEEYLKKKPADIGETCYSYEKFGRCNRGLACRFGKSHITETGRNKVNKLKLSTNATTINQLTHDLQISLKKRTYDFKLSEAVVKFIDKQRKEQISTENKNGETAQGVVTDEDIIKLQERERKTINWQNKLFLSPLTTVGNLPFRRICKEFGVDVTCGEMAMCSSLLQGAPQEWALTKRHCTEDIFGVQLCTNNPHLLTKCGQLLEKEVNIDFIDLNLGCPIELIYKQGGGSGLLRRPKVLESCIRSLNQIITVPLTIKTRTGVYSNENIAHTLIPKFKEWGASLVTIHGRSREQRYTKQADWKYIKECAQVAAPLPVLGNGDILSYDDYKFAMNTCPEITGIMIGRGALIKPWIFTEIKEEKIWDISSSERFDILKKYVNYGLEHWGSDNKGVENTRRFLLEWLSFLHRYVPVGLLETPPQKINERPPYYKGRNDLETLMASTSAADWIKISEMLLGPVPENFIFLPKHKANSYNVYQG